MNSLGRYGKFVPTEPCTGFEIGGHKPSTIAQLDSLRAAQILILAECRPRRIVLLQLPGSEEASIPLETAARSTPALDSSRSRFPAIFLQSAEVAVTKNDSKSGAYEFRTKSAQSEALERNGRGEAILGVVSTGAVLRFSRESPLSLVL